MREGRRDEVREGGMEWVIMREGRRDGIVRKGKGWAKERREREGCMRGVKERY